MKFLVQLALLAALGYGAYYYYENHILETPEAPAPEAEPPPEPVTHGPRNIACATCEGEGRLVYVDVRGQSQRYSCRICGAMGSRSILIPQGGRICGDCNGMGRVATRQTRRDARSGYVIDATRCQRCAGTGFVVPRVPSG